ncbi:hypothetical protein ACFQS6_04455 [Xanthomonas populi]
MDTRQHNLGMTGAWATYGNRGKLARVARMIAAGDVSGGTQIDPHHDRCAIVGLWVVCQASAVCRSGVREAHLNGPRIRH